MRDARGRGLIINHIISALAVKRPRAFLLENVKGLVAQHKATFKQNMQRLRHMAGSAYKVGFKIIDTADFGIPQHRERVYIVGLLRDAMVPGFSFTFTWPTPQRRIALGTALGWRKTRQTRGAQEGNTISRTRHAQAAKTSQASLAQHPPEGRGPQGNRPTGGGGHRWEQTSLDARDESLLDTCEGVHRALLTSSWAEVDNPRTVATPSAACSHPRPLRREHLRSPTWGDDWQFVEPQRCWGHRVPDACGMWSPGGRRTQLNARGDQPKFDSTRQQGLESQFEVLSLAWDCVPHCLQGAWHGDEKGCLQTQTID